MSNRKIRVGELIKREISDILHTRFKGRAVMITITEVDVSPDNKNAKVLYSVVETKSFNQGQAQRFLDNNQPMIKRELSKRIVLKYLPALQFVFDEKNLAAARVNELLDTLGVPEEPSATEGEDDSSPEPSRKRSDDVDASDRDHEVKLEGEGRRG